MIGPGTHSPVLQNQKKERDNKDCGLSFFATAKTKILWQLKGWRVYFSSDFMA